MKKLLLTLAIVVFAFTGNAQDSPDNSTASRFYRADLSKINKELYRVQMYGSVDTIFSVEPNLELFTEEIGYVEPEN